MTKEIHYYRKEIDKPVDRTDVDDLVSDFTLDVGTERFQLYRRVFGLFITDFIDCVIYVVKKGYHDNITFDDIRNGPCYSGRYCWVCV